MRVSARCSWRDVFDLFVDFHGFGVCGGVNVGVDEIVVVETAMVEYGIG